jgi:hypothetical protein
VSVLGLLVLILGVAILVGMYQRLTTPAPEATGAAAAPPTATAPASPRKKDASPQSFRRPPVELGLNINDPRAYPGYTLLAPMTSGTTYLIDLKGRAVNTWKSDCSPALGAMLLENGHLLRPGALNGEPHPLNGSGAGGRIQEFTWEGRPVWDYTLATDNLLPHHDISRLPNGHVLVLAWEAKTVAEALAAGRRNLSGAGPFLPDCLLEVRPDGPTGGEVVWEWHVWDHLIQDVDPSQANYGDVAEHPELIDVNFGENPIPNMTANSTGMTQLRSLGYAGGGGGRSRSQRMNSDWTHINAVAYNPELDQIMLTAHAFSEIWVIDHGTTRAEAAGHSGGRHGRGGDLLYRWGNPRTYRAGKHSDQRLFFPHGGHWIPRGRPGEGHALVFNNGSRRGGGPYSSVDEIELPLDDQARYALEVGQAFAPNDPVWSYTAPVKADFYSMLLSGAQRLPNGNTLICSGMSGVLFEVTPDQDVVWKYTCPVGGTLSSNSAGGMGPPGGSALFRGLRYSLDDPSVAGRDIVPGKTLQDAGTR